MATLPGDGKSIKSERQAGRKGDERDRVYLGIEG